MKFFFLFNCILFFNIYLPLEPISQNEPTKNIEIIIPAKGSSIECFKTKTGKKASFTVKGNSINIREGEYITLFLKPKNDSKWIRISSSNKVEQNYLGSWAFNIDVEISNRCKVAELSAIVSSSEIKDRELDVNQLNSAKNLLCRSQQDFVITAQ